ncbi:MAG: hemerythrin domain-containing protein [Polyangiaceae bacterium]
MDPFSTLNDEHRLIEKVIAALRSYDNRIDHGADPADLGRFVEVIAGFADARHHTKEEDILFETMVAAGFPRQHGPIAVMLSEHEMGRRYVGMLREVAARAGQWTAEDRARIHEAVEGYSALLTQHIAKEDMILYPMARRNLPEEAVTAMEARFDELEGGEDAQSELENFLSIIDSLSTRYLDTHATSVRPLSMRTVAAAHR